MKAVDTEAHGVFPCTRREENPPCAVSSSLLRLRKDWNGDLVQTPVEVSVESSGTELRFGLVTPPGKQSSLVGSFREGLWNEDVVELFLGTSSSRAYWEMHLNANGEWWLCPFTEYRHRRTPHPAAADFGSHIGVVANGDGHVVLTAGWSLLRSLFDTEHAEPEWRANVTAVVSDRAANPPHLRYLSYARPPGSIPKPDFHREELRQPVVFLEGDAAA